MRRFELIATRPLVAALAFILFLSISACAWAAARGPVPPSEAKENAARLILKVAAAGNHPGGMPRWRSARAGEPLLISSSDGKPSEYMVPVLDSSNKTISTVGVDAEHGDWHWYSDYSLDKFPLVSASEASSMVKGWMKRKGMGVSSLSVPSLRIAPDKRIYWFFKSDGSRIAEVYAPVFSKEEPSDKPCSASKLTRTTDEMSSKTVTGASVAKSRSSRGAGAPVFQPGTGPVAYDIEGIPYHAQETSWWCGPASLEMVMDYFGPDVNQGEIAGVANQGVSYGVCNSELARAAHFSNKSVSIQNINLRGYHERSSGYGMASAFWEDGSANYDRRYADIKDLISQDIPVIALTYYWDPPSSGHFRVVKGYNDDLGIFIVHDPWYEGSPSGPDVNFNQAQFVDTLWEYSNRWAMIAAPWIVDVNKPYSVTAGQTFAVTADVNYRGSGPMAEQYSVENPTATLQAGSADYEIVSGPANEPVAGIDMTGSAGAVSWTVKALRTRRTDNIQVVAQGIVSGSTAAYGDYEDTIGGVGAGAPPAGPTTRAWGHDSVGASSPSETWYLAEGCTGDGFETWVLVQNPNAILETNVKLDFQTSQGKFDGPSVTILPGSRMTFNVADWVPNEYDVSTTVTSQRAVVAERAVYAFSRTVGTDSIGAKTPLAKWYLAEGCTNGGMETWILVQNPNSEDARITLSYMTSHGPETGPTAKLPGNSRMTFNVADSVPDEWSVSTVVSSNRPVIAERSMYGNGRTWGHDSVGAPGPSLNWYLAEGCTGAGFETWVLVQNPNDEAASVTLAFMTESGPASGPTAIVPANSRKTFFVADFVPNQWSVSTTVNSTMPVIAERAMYGNNRSWGHDSIGVTQPETTWYLAEGCTGAGFETWVLAQNPGDEDTVVTITYMTPAGPVPGPVETLPAHTRKTYNIADTVSGEWQVSTMVTGSRPIIAERAMYGNRQ